SYVAISYISNCLEMLGRPVAEIDASRALALEREVEYVRRHPEEALGHVFLGISLIRDAQIEPGVAQIDRALELSPDDGRIRYNAACGFARAGMRDRAIHELKEGTRRLRSFISDWPARDPDLASLHADPEFLAMFGPPGSASRGPLVR